MKKKQSLVYAPKVNAIFEADIGNRKKALSGKPLTQAVKPVTMGKLLPFRRKLK